MIIVMLLRHLPVVYGMDVGKVKAAVLRPDLEVEEMKMVVVVVAAVEIVARVVRQTLALIPVMIISTMKVGVCHCQASHHFLNTRMAMTCLMTAAALVEVCILRSHGGLVGVDITPAMMLGLKPIQPRIRHQGTSLFTLFVALFPYD